MWQRLQTMLQLRRLLQLLKEWCWRIVVCFLWRWSRFTLVQLSLSSFTKPKRYEDKLFHRIVEVLRIQITAVAHLVFLWTQHSSSGIWFLFMHQESGEKVERMTGKDAAMFPIIASGFLLGIYVIFKVSFFSSWWVVTWFSMVHMVTRYEFYYITALLERICEYVTLVLFRHPGSFGSGTHHWVSDNMVKDLTAHHRLCSYQCLCPIAVTGWKCWYRPSSLTASITSSLQRAKETA